jgi:CheY-like chemotaxis protein
MGGRNSGRTILLVDDDDEVRSVLRRGLEREGFRVVAALDEWDGVERGAHESPDLILMELGRVLPGEALAAGRRVRVGAGIPEHVPVVAYANNAGEVARDGEAVEVRPREYVVLPEDTEQLMGWLRRLAA